ncbi:AMER2 isoform 1 [Pan troglodytes]|uniref:APC membrane recruitment protein 2 n=2 Tax=Pan troglodytes TaxID=9598 RepID=H2RA89_PANTR|nr:APC membrane recruitment protein 2 isoform X2 [Pan troglodytes]PNI94772.1 AMER2 isoform 1 [Pan troglodytes]
METSRSRGGGGAVSERGGAGASVGVCRRKAEAGAGTGTLAADMDLHCDCAAETPAAEPPSGKINKAAFKLFKKRKSGGTMPSIFGVKNKGDGKSSGPTGLVRSRTHDGLAEVLVLESGRKEEPRSGGDSGGGGGGRPNPGPPRAAGPGGGSLASSSVAKSHSFFSLLKKNGRSENGKGEPADASKAGGKQKRGLRGLFSGMRWHRKDKRAKAEAAEGRAPGGGLILPGSLTASLECVKEETPRAAREPEEPSQDAPRDPAGCGDIIADQEEEAGPSCDKHVPGPGKPALSKKNPGVVAYQGGGEEMASPDEVDDTYLQEFWDMLSQTEEQGPEPQEGAAKVAAALETKVVPETPKDTRCVEAAKDASSVKRRRLNRIPIEPHPKEEPKHPEKEQQEGVPNSDEGYWDSTTPGPEEDSSSSGKEAGIPRDSYSGDALYDLYADPDGSPATLPGGKDNEETSSLSRLKPVSPGTITCPLRTPGSLLKDSKIPISIKHLTNLPSSHPVVHQQPSRSEMPRTKIPVSKVLVRRVSNRGLAGTTIRATACHDSAKKL